MPIIAAPRANRSTAESYAHVVAEAIAVEHLVKRFPGSERSAVDDISFQVRRGETFGLLGPNGAGKSTTIGILTTMIRPSSGQALVAGIDVADDPIGAKRHIAVVPQRNNLDRTLRVVEILTFHAAYHGVPRAVREKRANALLEELGLSERRKQKLGLFSGGMEQRLMLARALMTNPEVLFLDEPTNNLDPQSRLFLWERLRELHQQGLTVVLTTHDMDEADRLCQRIAIMDQGRLLALDTPAELKRLIPGGTVLELRVAVPQAVQAEGGPDRMEDGHQQRDGLARTLGEVAGVSRVEVTASAGGAEEAVSIRVYADGDPGALVAGVALAAIQAETHLLDLRFAQPSLEDVFIYLTGRNLRS